MLQGFSEGLPGELLQRLPEGFPEGLPGGFLVNLLEGLSEGGGGRGRGLWHGCGMAGCGWAGW